MSWFTWIARILAFGLWFAREFVVSNITVLRDNLTPGQASTPGVASFVTRCRTDTELTWLAALITLTPGTLALGTAVRAGPASERVLYVHGMYSPDAEHFRAQLQTMETRLLGALRRQGALS